MAEIVREIPLVGFEEDAEPTIRVMSDGSLYVVIEFMPPSWAPKEDYTSTNLGPFHDFDNQMETAIGVPVYWEDREFFLIRKPEIDTPLRIQKFLESYRRTHGYA